MVDPLIMVLVAIILFSWGVGCWLSWLYIQTYRRLVVSDRDRDRLIRRIGVYHSLPLITPYEHLPGPDIETPIPPAFRMRRPTPPPGWRPKKGDL